MRDIKALNAPYARLLVDPVRPTRHELSTTEVVWVIHSDCTCATEPERLARFTGRPLSWWSRFRGQQRLFLCWCTIGPTGSVSPHPLHQLRHIAERAADLRELYASADSSPIQVASNVLNLKQSIRVAVNQATRAQCLEFWVTWLKTFDAEITALIDNRRARLASRLKGPAGGDCVLVAFNPHSGLLPTEDHQTSDERDALAACPVVHWCPEFEVIVRVHPEHADLHPHRGFEVLGPERPMSQMAWHLYDQVRSRTSSINAYQIASAAGGHVSSELIRISTQLLDAGVPIRELVTTARAIAE